AAAPRPPLCAASGRSRRVQSRQVGAQAVPAVGPRELVRHRLQAIEERVPATATVGGEERLSSSSQAAAPLLRWSGMRPRAASGGE
ncbi:unnamed protein product, partial [Urochloa humidicola]